MIRRVHLENFKSFQKATLPLAPLTLLVGANASGKSNAIEGLELLKWMASGRELGDFLYAQREDELNIRGQEKDLFNDGGRPFRLQSTIEWPEGAGPLTHTVDIALRSGGLGIVGETLKCPALGAQPIYTNIVEAAGNVTTLHTDLFDRPGQESEKSIQFGGHDQLLALVGLTHLFADKTQASKPSLWVQQRLKSSLLLDPDLRHMRGYSLPSERGLQGDGSNLSAVLWNLVQEQNQKDEILAFVRSLPEQDIEDIRFIETPRDEVMVQLVETFGGRSAAREAAVLSDGTLRVLGVAAAVLSVPRGSLVVIEEIDNGVHPSRAKLLLENLQRVAEERGLKILLTTHNPALQDALPDRSLPHVVACYRDPETGESRLQRLEDLERYPHLVARGSLGELTTQGTLERFLKDRTTPEERIEKETRWLEELEATTGD